MKASGLFFLRMHASLARKGDESVLLLPVVERDPTNWRATVNTLDLEWRGPAATVFYAQHERELRAGRPLQIDIERMRPRSDGTWACVVTRCELAPLAPSWQHPRPTTEPGACAHPA